MNKPKALLALELKKEICHVMIHRMNLWQFITKGGFFRKLYDRTCEQIAEINQEIENGCKGQETEACKATQEGKA
jgi:hypothetical protein